MNSISAFFALLVVASMAHAGNPPQTSCSNLGGTIVIAQNQVSILMSKHPTDLYAKFSKDDLEISEKVVQQMPLEEYGCTSRSVVFKQIAITKKDGSEMPDAYNRLVQDGSLNDYFICATSSAWIPASEQSCN